MDLSKMNLSLNGCGYLGIYHVGVCSCIKKHQPQVLKNKMSGGSVGALVACAFMCDVPLETCTKYVFDVSMKVRNGILGPMTPDLHIMRVLYESMDAMLPDDAHLHCDGKLHISVTRYADGKNVLLHHFHSREELLQALMCSCFIPVYCGYEPPVFHGEAYVDAALSNNSPRLDEDTVTVAPFSGYSNICPQDDAMLLRPFTLSHTSIGLTAKNLYMMFRVLFPGSPDTQRELCQKGYNDALRYLRDNDLTPCLECVADSTADPRHLNCPLLEETIPNDITNEIGAAIEKFQKNLGYRLFQYKSMKWLYYMNIPSIMTAKLTYVVCSAVLQKVQNKAGSCVDDLWSHFLHILKDGITEHNECSKLSCHVDCKHAEKIHAKLNIDEEINKSSKHEGEKVSVDNLDVTLDIPRDVSRPMTDDLFQCQKCPTPVGKGLKVPYSNTDVQIKDVYDTYVY